MVAEDNLFRIRDEERIWLKFSMLSEKACREDATEIEDRGGNKLW